MNTVYAQSQSGYEYEVANPIISLGRWEFCLYLLIAFLIGYLVHYYFSHRRDYVRSPRKKKAFYYNDSLNSGYYPNSEPIQPRRIIQTPIYDTQPELVPEPISEPLVHVSIPSIKDDLKKVEGIGPKIEELLNKAGIHTWETLAKVPVENLKSVLDQAGKKFQIHDPSTWAEQAHLAHTGQWTELQNYQSFLIGGKHN